MRGTRRNFPPLVRSSYPYVPRSCLSLRSLGSLGRMCAHHFCTRTRPVAGSWQMTTRWTTFSGPRYRCNRGRASAKVPRISGSQLRHCGIYNSCSRTCTPCALCCLCAAAACDRRGQVGRWPGGRMSKGSTIARNSSASHEQGLSVHRASSPESERARNPWPGIDKEVSRTRHPPTTFKTLADPEAIACRPPRPPRSMPEDAVSLAVQAAG